MLYFRKVPELARLPFIVIDDAQDLPDATLAEIKSLVDFDLDVDTVDCWRSLDFPKASGSGCETRQPSPLL